MNRDHATALNGLHVLDRGRIREAGCLTSAVVDPADAGRLDFLSRYDEIVVLLR